MYLGVSVSLDNDMRKVVSAVCILLTNLCLYKHDGVLVVWESGPPCSKKRFVWACLDTILQAELPATFANPAAVWCDT